MKNLRREPRKALLCCFICSALLTGCSRSEAPHPPGGSGSSARNADPAERTVTNDPAAGPSTANDTTAGQPASEHRSGDRQATNRPGKYEPIPATMVPQPRSKSPLNLIFVSLDTVRADALGCYGHPSFLTPAIDDIAKAGVRFDQVVTHIPETALSHWAIMTSIEPPLHGNVNQFGTSRYRGPTLQEILKTKGYSTGAVIGGVTMRSDIGLARGFDVYDEDFAFGLEHLKRPGDEVTDRALQFIRSRQDGPFFLLVHYFDAHFPYEPPPPHDTRYDPDYRGQIDGSDKKLTPFRDGKAKITARDLEHVKALYGGEISFLDDQVGRLMAELALMNLVDQTLVVLFSDHGESFEHDYLFNHADVLYDSTLIVPLIMKLPGGIRPGTTIDAQVRTIDITPTVLDLLGIARDRKFQGKSLIHLLDGKPQLLPAAFSATDPWREPGLESVRENAWKLIRGPDDKLEVYELTQDPRELTNLGSRSLPVAAVLAGLLDKHIRDRRELEKVLMGPQLPPRPMLSPEEARQLEALGYLRKVTPPPTPSRR